MQELTACLGLRGFDLAGELSPQTISTAKQVVLGKIMDAGQPAALG